MISKGKRMESCWRWWRHLKLRRSHHRWWISETRAGCWASTACVSAQCSKTVTAGQNNDWFLGGRQSGCFQTPTGLFGTTLLTEELRKIPDVSRVQLSFKNLVADHLDATSKGHKWVSKLIVDVPKEKDVKLLEAWTPFLFSVCLDSLNVSSPERSVLFHSWYHAAVTDCDKTGWTIATFATHYKYRWLTSPWPSWIAGSSCVISISLAIWTSNVGFIILLCPHSLLTLTCSAKRGSAICSSPAPFHYLFIDFSFKWMNSNL